MSKIFVYIVDDEKANQEILEIMLQNYFPEFAIIGFAESAETALKDPKLFNANLLFLDVMMPNKTGFELLQELENYPFETIFVSGYDEFAIKAFTFSAIDYILKPIDKDKLIKAVHRALQRIDEKIRLRELDKLTPESNLLTKLEATKNDKIYLIDLEEIAYFIGSSGGYTEFFTKTGENYVISSSLKQLEQDIRHFKQFVRVNKSVIINMDDIHTIDKGQNGYIALHTNSFDLFISRRRKREVVNLVNERLSLK